MHTYPPRGTPNAKSDKNCSAALTTSMHTYPPRGAPTANTDKNCSAAFTTSMHTYPPRGAPTANSDKNCSESYFARIVMTNAIRRPPPSPARTKRTLGLSPHREQKLAAATKQGAGGRGEAFRIRSAVRLRTAHRRVEWPFKATPLLTNT